MPAGAAAAIRHVPGAASTAIRFDQVKVAGSRGSNMLTDIVIGVEPSTLRAVYTIDWLHGSDQLLTRLGPGQILVEEQFARSHHLHVGGSVGLTTPTGRSARLHVVGEYRDPLLMQGSIVSLATFERLSAKLDVTGSTCEPGPACHLRPSRRKSVERCARSQASRSSPTRPSEQRSMRRSTSSCTCSTPFSP